MNTIFKKIKYAYFAGIGGIGMSALARWFNKYGIKTFGYDSQNTHLINQLDKEGIIISLVDDINTIPKSILNNPESSLIIYTPAINKLKNNIIQHLEKNSFKIYKRAEILAFLCKEHYNIAVGGTHGKTTTSSMITHIMKEASTNFSAFLGGITKNYNSNFISNNTDKITSNEIVICEADEFDKSFLNLSPQLSIITSIDEDHLDIYNNTNNLHNTYLEFINQTTEKTIIHYSAFSILGNKITPKTITYSLDKGDIYAKNIIASPLYYIFDYVSTNKTIKQIKLSMPGSHNIENALAAIITCLEIGISIEEIRKALSNFKGIKRRFEYIINRYDLIFIDDYAHHPTEIIALLNSVKKIYKDKKITAIFQPHLYSRTRDFAPHFAESLSLADNLALLPIYPAREQPIQGITSSIILEKATSRNKALINDNEILDYIKTIKPEVLVTIGAGSIGDKVDIIKSYLLNTTSIPYLK